jgi:hypothetical protein
MESRVTEILMTGAKLLKVMWSILVFVLIAGLGFVLVRMAVMR